MKTFNTQRSIIAVLLLASSFLLPPSSFLLARMGESPAQIATRYGPVRGTNTTVNGEPGFHYATNHYDIVVHYVQTGTNTWASDAEFFFYKGNMTNVELDALLESQAQGARWIVTEVPTMDRLWKRSDGGAIAFQPFGADGLWVSTPGYWASFERAVRRKASKETEGF